MKQNSLEALDDFSVITEAHYTKKKIVKITQNYTVSQKTKPYTLVRNLYYRNIGYLYFFLAHLAVNLQQSDY